MLRKNAEISVPVHLSAIGRRMFFQQIAVKRIVTLIKKRLLPTVAPLGNLMKKAGDDDAGKCSPVWDIPR
jgi:hypothetical protein